MDKLDLLNCSIEEYDDFINLYNPDLENLCINKKTVERTQNLYQFINRKGSDFRSAKYTIIYLYEETSDIQKHIIAFALIDTNTLEKHNVIILELLCSHINSKKYKINKKSLGKYLLDYLFEYYKIYSTQMILKIQPATEELIKYYTEWKMPNISITNLVVTHGYLIYGNIKLISDDTLKYLFNSQINSISRIMNYLSISKLPIELNTLEKTKIYLLNEASKSDDESLREQIPGQLDLIKYTSLEEIKDIFIENE